jgi:hypothetical protein
MLSHTSGLSSLEDEEIMGYYQAIGDSRGTLLMRYFMSSSSDMRAKALPEVQHVMNSLVTSPFLMVSQAPIH